MSRCFPYPPPGFEPKLKNDHVDLLLKEKHKDKKQKKEKKDKDKRDGKEKREKDEHHSKEKNRDGDRDKEKKEKKEKHKHKKKEKGRDKESDKDKHRVPSVLLPVPTEKTPEDSRILSEYSRRVDEGSQAGPGNQFMERRVAGTSTYGASEKRPVPVPVQQSVPSVHRKNNDSVKVGPTSQTTNHRVTIVSERRVAGMPSTSSPEEGMIAKRTVPSASNPNAKNSNSLIQRKSNGPPTQVVSHHGTGLTERRVVGAEAKKPVPSPLNSLQGKSNGPTSQSTNHSQLPLTGSTQNRLAATERGEEAKRVVGNSVMPVQRKTGAAGLSERRVGSNQNMGPTSTPDEDREKGGLNLRGIQPDTVKEEGKREKRKERDEKKAREKELRRHEKRQRKEREKEERKKEKEIERDKAKEVGSSMMRHSIEGLPRNIEKVGATTDGFLSKKRKDGEINGFLHEDDLRAKKLARTSPQNTLKRKDASTNGFVHETDVGPTKLTKKLPPYPPPLENGRTSNHLPPLLPPPVKLSSSSPSTTTTNNTPANISTIKADVKKAQQLNGTVPDAKVSKKRKEEPPHPDLKYLNVVYSVPKLEEKELVPPFDDQEWLFGTKPNRNPNLHPNSTMPESGLSQGPGQVWDRAVLLDSTDAFALPYVVPF
ncbi:uncharacterized protein LOC144569691 [Carex rostrata]